MLKNAKWYKNRGFIPIPLIAGSKFPPSKFPLRETRWDMPTEESLETWFTEPSNLAIQPKGWQALDMDRADWIQVMEQEGIDDTFSYNTTRGGHVWVRGWNGAKIDNVEVMGDEHEKKYVVAPPSTVDGVKRQWRHPEKLKDLRVTNLPFVARASQVSMGKDAVVRVRENERISKGRVTLSDPVGKFSLVEGSRDESLYHAAACLKRGGMARQDAVEILRILGKSCSPPFNGVDKVVSAYDAGLPSERNLSEEIETWISVTKGPFSVTDMDKELENVTKRDKANRRKVMSRLVERGVVRRGKKNGHFQRIERELEEIDLRKSPNIDFLPLVWPLHLENHIGLFPGTICVVNGVKDAGKTAFLMRFVEMNMGAWPKRIHYFNSEMGDVEFHNRLSKFDRPKSDWNFRAYHRNINFSEVIKPDDVNVIDFLEIHKDFYEISALMWDIHDQLGSGVAIIALQKNPGADLGLGGYRSIEKARLVLNLEPGELLIHTAKGWANPDVSPRGMVIKFKLVGGCKFIDDTPRKIEGSDADHNNYKMGRDQYGPTFTRRT